MRSRPAAPAILVGIFLMALLMGLGGGAIGYFTAYIKGQLFREGYFQVLTSFSPPLYAVTARAGVSRPVGERYGRFEMTAHSLPAASTSGYP